MRVAPVPRFALPALFRRVRGLSQPFRADPDTYMEELWLEDRDDR